MTRIEYLRDRDGISMIRVVYDERGRVVHRGRAAVAAVTQGPGDPSRLLRDRIGNFISSLLGYNQD